GLEADTGNLYLTRNAYENGNHQTTLEKGKIYQYKAEFLTVENGRYTRIDEESAIYQSMITNVPVFRGNVTGEEKTNERYTLTVFAHFARSIPLGSLFSAALGRNVSYIYAELYQDKSFRSSGTVGRLSLGSISVNMTGKNLLQKLQTALGIFDWKNLTLFKKIRFPDLDPGTYLVKIYRENPRFAKERQYIGFALVDLTKDTAIRIRCRPQGAITVSLIDQENQAVENAHCILLSDNTTVADAVTDSEGHTRLFAPCYSLKPYHLKILYQGFLIGEEQVKLTSVRRIIDLKKSFTLERYGLSLTVTDTWGFAPAVDVNPTLVSSEMVSAITIRAESSQAGTYRFSNLLPASYQLSLSYKSFRLEQDVRLQQGTSLAVVFPAEFSLDLAIFNSYADRLSGGEVSLQRSEKTKSTAIQQNGTAYASIPPGDYELIVHANTQNIAQQQIQMRGDKKMEILTSQGSLLHTILLYLGILFLVGAIGFLIWKRQLVVGLKLITISLLIIALVSPWWALNGETGSVSTTTNTMVIPPKLITLTKSSNATGGEISAVPDEVTMVLGLLSLLVGVVCVFLVVSLLTERKLRKITLLVSFLSIVLILLTLVVFYYALDQLTQVGVGSFMGSGTLDITVPGQLVQTAIPCSWGPSISFYLLILSFVLLVFAFFMKRFTSWFSGKE
ncbi:MAG: carboxypeptidase regulatory-like domain-containing protein, partial [Candidatus Thermoplasmatota archaeon]|nr:carboxypeptidase regulatory-like domain-containing protein [Candidatus Thermoplasmatota archaeon]